MEIWHTEEQQEYFENSKVRDEETGGLQIVYHGTKWAGFTVFDARESGNGNYRFGNEVVNFFTDSDEMAGSYTSRNRKEQKYFKTFDNMTIERANELLSDYGEKTGDPTIRLVKGKDLKIKREGYNPDYLYIEYDDGNSVLSRDGYKSMTQAVNEGFVETQLAFGEDGETELFLFLEKEIGDVYEGYLNIENPYVVDAKGRFWNDIVDPELEEKYIKKGSEVVEKYENKEINKNTTTNLMKDLENIGLKVELIDENSDGFVVMFEESSVLMFKNGETFSGQTLTNLQKVIKQRAYETKTTNQFVFRALNKAAKGENYDGVIIKNVIDYGDYRDNMQPHNIYISTKSPSQFKLKDNKTPTGDPDIRFSRKRRTPPPGQMELDLSIGQVVPVEQNPIATIEEQASFAETREKNPKQKTNVNVEETIKQTSEQVKSKMPKENQTVGEKVTTAYKAIEEFFNNRNAYILNLQIQLTNSFAGVEKRAKDFYTEKFTNEGLTGTTLKNKVNEELTKLKALQLKAVRTDAGANYTLKNDLYDGIWKGINAKGAKYTNLFETFLLHRLNVKRMRYKWLDPQVRKQLNTMLNNGEINQEQYDMFVEEAKHIEKKKLFKDIVDENGNKKEVTAEVSEEILAQMEKEHPEFVKLADKVYHYLNMLMDIREQAGIVSKQQRAFMKEHYGDWYVPSYRENEYGATTSGLSGKGAIGVSKGIHGAKGSELDIQSIMSSMAKQTMGVYKQAVMNELFQKVQEIAPDAFEETSVARQTRKDMDGEIEPKKNEVYFYKDGKRTTYKTTDDIAAAFKTLRNDKSNNLENNYVAKGLEKLVSIMKKVTTEYNPFFAVRNLFRDASDTFIYTKYSPNLIKRYNRALQEIRNNGEYYKLYQMNGGNAFSFFDQENGLDLRKKNKILNAISTVNEITELLPRLSEFMESVDAHYSGKLSDIDQQTVDMAMLDASEVTVNFARGGTFTKKLNKYLMPYLNASVQGWCKTWNTFVHPTSMRAWGMSMAKIVLMALPTLIFNEIWYDDDEEYQQLSDDIKGSYFLIKTGNNKFIRIPRGRVEAVVGDAMQRIYRSAKGEENAFEGYAKNTLKNVSPIDNMTRTILSPVTDVTTNTTWYGGQIENRAMQELPVQERYDANTSSIAKALNKIVPSVSPKKWHYLLDQYSGILGDVVLPLTSQNKSLSGISGLKVDSLSNNKYTNEFYKTIEEIEQTRNSSKGTAVDKAKMRYMNKMNTKINELYKAKRTTNDKEEQEALQALIVKLQKDAVVSVKEFEKVLKKYEYGLSQDELYDDYYREANRECFGAEVALMDYDGRVYEKACIFNKCGINWDTFYNVYFDAQDIMADYDADGNVVSGSKKQKVTQYVKSLNLNATQKYMIMGLLGYKNTNGESQVRSLLRSKGYTGEELENIMKICGYGK